MKYFIITGASRGLGESLVKALITKGNFIYCISRNKNESLIKLAAENHVGLEYITFDLSQVGKLDSLMHGIFSKIDDSNMESLVLINNAGILAPIKPTELCSSEEIITNTHINMTAPMILSSSFISHASHIKANKQIINISSGAGKKPYYGWSSYCSAKAGLDHFTRCIGVEQSVKENSVRIISISPGVVDTQMQQEIRTTPREHFQDIDRFISLKEDGKLQDPDAVARRVLDLIHNDEIKNGEIIDIRQFQ